MLTDSEIIAFVAATNAAQTKSFYQDTLGLVLVSEEPGRALVFQAGATILRISLIQELTAARFTVLGWKIEGIEHTIDGLSAKGVVFERFPGFNQDERAIWTTPDGAKIAWFKDPNGNLLSLTEFPDS